jgi:hypothetical protein
MRLISIAMTVLTLQAEPQGEASGRENYTTFAKPPIAVAALKCTPKAGQTG